MSSDINMASNALLLIGAEPIVDFDDPGAGATVAKAIYPDTYTMILSEHPWSFAFKEQYLNQLSESPDPETNFKYAYQMPTDVIRVWAVLPHGNYTIVGDKVYSNDNKLLMRYVYKVAETRVPPHVVKAIEYKLASDFAISVTEDFNLASIYENKFLMQLSKAKNIDSQGRPQQSIVDSPFVDVRLSGRSFGAFD